MISVLPTHISNLIAAGEVVQRPASVVKELMENAVDAGADSIVVVIRDSGKSLIQVIDNGCGMSSEDAKLAFKRHATSKIAEIEDLNTINTFGFRGEALASIAAVAEVTLRTRRESAEMGSEIKISESVINSESAVNCPVGCNFMIRNLFYNMPARRKFLKSDASEYRNIVSEFIRVALTRPHVSFKLTHNDRDVYNLPVENRKQRIVRIFGNDLAKEIANIDVNTSVVKITGYLGTPESSKKTAGNQYLFVNNRFFRSSYFQKAIQKAYENLIPEGNIPSFFIFFEVDPDKIDVNIHPSKTEIKFEDDFTLFNILNSAVRETIGKNAFMPSIDFDQEGRPEIPIVQKNFFAPSPKVNYDPLFNPFEREYYRNIDEEAAPRLFDNTHVIQNQLIRIANRYIITTIKTGVILIDMKSATERIFYDRFINVVSGSSMPVHKMLFPKSIALNKLQMSLLSEHKDTLLSLGFDIVEDGESVVLQGIPEDLIGNQENVEEIIDDLFVELENMTKDIQSEIKERIVRKIAHSSAAYKSYTLNNVEAQSLIDSLFACSEPSLSPSGERCMRLISIDELGRLLN